MITSPRLAFAAGAAALAVAATVSACSGGGSGSGYGAGYGGGGGKTVGSTAQTVRITASAGTLVGPNGHTLYENTLDTASKITCTGGCASAWPPLTGDPIVSGPLDASDFATVTRPDGSQQVSFQGHPLYYFAEDTSPGDHKGNGMTDAGGSWHLASASPVSTTGGTSSAPVSVPSMSSGGGYGGGGY